MTTEWIAAERNSASDEELAVVSVLADPGALVRPGDPVLEMEGAKAVFEVEASSQGHFYSYVEVGARVAIGATLGLISTEPLEELPPSPLPEHEAEAVEEARDEADAMAPAATDAAVSLARELGVDLADIEGHDLITSEAVRSHAASMTGTGAPTQRGPSAALLVTRVLVLGGGNGAVQLREAASTNTGIALIGVMDDRQNTLASSGVPTMGGLTEEEVAHIFATGQADGVAIAISSRMDLRQKWRRFCEDNGIPLVSIIHSGAFVAKSARIAPGALIMDSARVGAMASLEPNVFVSAGVDIEHHCEVGADTTFGPGVFLSGGVKIGAHCVFGSMIAVEPGLSIGSESIVSSGAVITSSIEARSSVKVVSSLRVRTRP